jgi:mannose-1-phosphate guanylyltransferase / mannose-6-phosphate isomerase
MIDGRRVVALLPVGGAGSRLWPLSADTAPKPFLKLLGPRSLYQLTLARLAAAAVDEVVVVANATLEGLVRDQAAEVGRPLPRLLLEPFARDSGPAIAAGVAAVSQGHPADTIVIAAPGDHLIPDQDAFARAVGDAVRVASNDWLVTFGIRATSASTEYGYVQRGEPLAGHDGAFTVARFHEKPRQDLADAYLRDGSYDWNSGIFVFTAGLFSKEAERHMPKVWAAAVRAVATGQRQGGRIVLDAEAFGQADKTSLDYALLEKTPRVATIPVSFEWSDIGNWSSVLDALQRDASCNAATGDAVLRDVSNTLVVADRVKVVVVGMEDVVVVSSPQGTFVAPRSRAAEIKGLV